MLDATFTLVAFVGVVSASSAGLLVLPWTEREVAQSLEAWGALRREVVRLAAGFGASADTRPPVVARAVVPVRAVAVGLR